MSEPAKYLMSFFFFLSPRTFRLKKWQVLIKSEKANKNEGYTVELAWSFLFGQLFVRFCFLFVDFVISFSSLTCNSGDSAESSDCAWWSLSSALFSDSAVEKSSCETLAQSSCSSWATDCCAFSWLVQVFFAFVNCVIFACDFPVPAEVAYQLIAVTLKRCVRIRRPATGVTGACCLSCAISVCCRMDSPFSVSLLGGWGVAISWSRFRGFCSALCARVSRGLCAPCAVVIGLVLLLDRGGKSSVHSRAIWPLLWHSLHFTSWVHLDRWWPVTKHFEHVTFEKSSGCWPGWNTLPWKRTESDRSR